MWLTYGQNLVGLKTRFSVLKKVPILLACIRRTKICSWLAVALGKSCKSNTSDHEIKMLFKFKNIREMGIFDMRYTATGEVAVPVVTFPKATKRVNGAFFSPISGKYALTTCADNTLTIYDVQKGKSEPECKIKSNYHQTKIYRITKTSLTGIKSIYHNNYIGRFLAPFKAVWHPQREDIFIVGSAEDPSRVIKTKKFFQVGRKWNETEPIILIG